MNNYPRNDFPQHDFPYQDYPNTMDIEGKGSGASGKQGTPDSDGLIFGLVAAMLALLLGILKFTLISICRGISLIWRITLKP